MKLNPRQYYEKLLDEMPAGLERGLLSILRFHIGLAESIEKEPLMLALDKGGFHLSDERQVRLAIVRLRKAGVPVCASSAEAGYFLPATYAEFSEFVNREYWKKIKDMTETSLAMSKSISKIFPGVSTPWVNEEDVPESFDPARLEVFIDQVHLPAPAPVQSSLF